MSVAQNLKSGQSTTAGSSFTAYTGLRCPKHNVQMIAKLEVPPNATVRRLSDKVFTTTNAYIISMGHQELIVKWVDQPKITELSQLVYQWHTCAD